MTAPGDAPTRLHLSPRHCRVATLAGGAICGWLVAWSAALAIKLPSAATAHHWAAAWVGLDLAEAAAAGSTAVLLARRDQRAALPAGVLATLLCTDAWFDVCTSGPGSAFAVATAEALCLELPLAAASAHLAWKLLAGRSR